MRARQARNLSAVLFSLLLLASGFNNCAPKTQRDAREAGLLAKGALRGGTSGGNPGLTALKFSPYQGVAGASIVPIPNTGGDLIDFTICAKEFRFRRSSDGIQITVPFAREISVLSDGTPIGDFALPLGSYDRVSVIIEDVCQTGRSMQVTNTFSGFDVTDPTEMTFDGPYKSETVDHGLTLDITAIASSLAVSSSNAEVIYGVSLPGGAIPNVGIDTRGDP